METVVNDPQDGSKIIRIQDMSVAGSMAERRPQVGRYDLAAPAEEEAATTTSIVLAPTDFQGDAVERTGMEGLQIADDVTMLCAPDLMSAYQAGVIDLEDR